jgi:hypothetical protein
LWADLAHRDAAKAYRAMCLLATCPRQTLALIREHIRPVPRLSPAELSRLVARLDADDFADRERAEGELRRLGEQALPALRESVKGRSASLEAQRRIEGLLDALEGRSAPPGETVRALRAVALLEHLSAQAGARELLEGLARGAPDVWSVQEAKAALQRINR